MGLNDTPSGERLTIGFFGARNAGKSSVANAVTGQIISVVSDTPGTTTDPVKKSMELLPLGPVTIIDTPGLDDVGELGEERVKVSLRVLASVDAAVIVIDAARGTTEFDEKLLKTVKERNLPYVCVYNKSENVKIPDNIPDDTVYVSAKSGYNIDVLKEKIATSFAKAENNKRLISDILPQNALTVLVVPIDEAAPKGRLILPQQQTIRDILDSHGTCICCQPDELTGVLSSLCKKPDVVITDSQVFGKVSSLLPNDVKLTSFSILFARYKGDLPTLVKGASAISQLKDGDTVLISEGCTHRRSCKDIGTVKIPALMRKFTGKELNFKFTSGGDFESDLSDVALVLHCGGCVLTEKEMRYRMRICEEYGTPIVNYGVAIAHMNGILKRSIEIFPDINM
ncbi:MAG: [Clostridia bacterium]|nr:[FeFe] hydrogenase H-cluster maturation GTPase HydF [Clostridia bacterium]